MFYLQFSYSSIFYLRNIVMAYAMTIMLIYNIHQTAANYNHRLIFCPFHRNHRKFLYILRIEFSVPPRKHPYISKLFPFFSIKTHGHAPGPGIRLPSCPCDFASYGADSLRTGTSPFSSSAAEAPRSEAAPPPAGTAGPGGLCPPLPAPGREGWSPQVRFPVPSPGSGAP